MNLSMWEELFVSRALSRVSSNDARYEIRETDNKKIRMTLCTCEECVQRESEM